MRKFVKLLALILVVVLLLPTGAMAVEVDDTLSEEEVNARIDALVDEWIEISNAEPVNVAALAAVEAELAEYGAEMLSDIEVIEQHPEAYEAVTGIDLDSVVSPRIGLPSSSHHTWTSQYLYVDHSDGITYEIQRLTARPKDDNASLRVRGSYNQTYSGTTSWTAGSTNIINLVGLRGTGTTINSTNVTAYSLFSGNNISSATTLQPQNVLYTWKTDTRVCFSYVREANGPSTQYHVYTASAASTEVTCSFVGTVDGKGGTKTLGGVRTISTTPSEFQSSAMEINAFKNYFNEELCSWTYRIKIYAPGSQLVANYTLETPNYLIHID